MNKRILSSIIIFIILISLNLYGTDVKIDLLPKEKQEWFTESNLIITWEPAIEKNINIILYSPFHHRLVTSIATNLNTKTLPTPNTFLWKIPLRIPSGRYAIKIFDLNENEITQSREFTIRHRVLPLSKTEKTISTPKPDIYSNTKRTSPRFIRITSPVRGDIWFNNRAYVIKWETSLTEPLRLHLCRAGDKYPVYTILSNTNKTLLARKNQYIWRIPNQIDPGIYMIRISPKSTIEWNYSKKFRIMKSPAGTRKNFRK